MQDTPVTGGFGIGTFQHHENWRLAVLPVRVPSTSPCDSLPLIHARKAVNWANCVVSGRVREGLDPQLVHRHRILPLRVPLRFNPG